MINLDLYVWNIFLNYFSIHQLQNIYNFNISCMIKKLHLSDSPLPWIGMRGSLRWWSSFSGHSLHLTKQKKKQISMSERSLQPHLATLSLRWLIVAVFLISLYHYVNCGLLIWSLAYHLTSETVAYMTMSIKNWQKKRFAHSVSHIYFFSSYKHPSNLFLLFALCFAADLLVSLSSIFTFLFLIFPMATSHLSASFLDWPFLLACRSCFSSVPGYPYSQ